MKQLNSFYASVFFHNINSNKVTFSSTLVCLQDYTKTTQPITTKFSGKVAHGQQKRPLDFGGNLCNVTLGLGLWFGEDKSYCRPHWVRFNRRLFNSNNFV